MNLHSMQVNLVKGRSYQDWADALAYSVYLIREGKIGSRAEREYIEAERASRQFRRLASSIKDFKYDDDDDLNEEDPDHIGESQSAVTPTGAP